MSKRCARCEQVKPVSGFAKNARMRDGLQIYCRDCQKLFNAESYQRTKGYQNPVRAKNLAELRKRNQSLVLNHLQNNPCVDCGEADIVVLQYDHQGDKQANVSRLIRGASLESLAKEIAKCHVVCANCHTRRTAKTFGWWRLDGS